MAVSEQTPYKEYTANGSANSFALEFDCENQDHLIVLVDDVEPVVGTWSLSDGAVVFGTAPINGKKITIQRNTPFRRDGDFQSYDNSFRPGSVNKGFDKTWWKIQELGVADWLLGLKLQKFRDDVNLTALENTLEEAKQIRDETADSVTEVQSNVEQSQTLLANTTAQSNLAQGYADNASVANAAAQQAAINVSTAKVDVYSALSVQQVEVNNSLTAIAGGHKAYQTLIAAQVAQGSLPINTIVEVTNDGVNNGSYQWNGTTLTKSAYDPLTQSKAYTRDQVDLFGTRIPYNPIASNNLFEFVDSEGNIALCISKEAKLVIPNLSTDVASEIKKVSENISSIDRDTNDLKKQLNSLVALADNDPLVYIVDNDSNIVAYFDFDSKLYIVGVEGDVATAINSKSENELSVIDTSNLSNYSYRDTFIPKAERLLSFFRNTQNSGLLAPVPLHTCAQNFSISTSWLSSAVISEWGNYIPIKTPYGDDRGVVHPQILEVPNKFMGYRYILILTGYTNGSTEEENPFLVGSNDLHDFELLTGLIDVPDSFTWEYGTVACSDPFTFYDIKTGELVLLYRFYWSVSDSANANKYKEIIYCKRTKDGKTWSEREVFHEPPGTSMFMSPAVLFDAKTETYHMYGVAYSADGTKRVIRHLSSKTCKNDWVEIGDIPSPAGTAIWHVDLKHVGDKQICVFQNRLGNTSVGFRTGISSNFHDFEWQSDWWNPQTYGVYKASFLPQFNAQNQMRLVYFWTTNQTPVDTNLKYKLFMQPTPYINVNFMET